MKTRLGFVSNSSSSSFIVSKNSLTEEQIEALHDVCLLPIGEYRDEWNLNFRGSIISGMTYMDNGGGEDGLFYWLKINGYPMGAFEWDDD